MKKIIALLLVAVMCFSLAACGGDNEASNNNEPQTNESGSQVETENNDTKEEKFNLYQEWKNVLTGSSLTFDKNGTVVTDAGKEYKYEYDKKLNMVSVYLSMTVNLDVTEENGIYKLGKGSTCLVTSDNYDEYHALAMEEEIGSETLVAVGETYTCENGIEATLNKVEVTDKTNGSFNLYFTCKNTTAEDISYPFEYGSGKSMTGSAFATSTSTFPINYTIDDSTIPTNSSKDIVVSTTIDESLEENSFAYILLGITHGEYTNEFNGFYVDVIGALSE